ncbi:aminoglycoside adenylyltransferase domain-containing protein [Clostridium amazonitimonense]|uniref:aminoglycoside adenylyltransferase domain-containing protein n=1 Tax=Clostridium amazonitimonense TaxID=1499689 RepID=UPI0005097B2C|nr:aminoglycoside adenylyltransferase domain-containing protein [Clostridium amazonitimonense]
MVYAKDILDEIVSCYHDILQDNLIGIYVHGSLAMNCFNPDISDIDFLMVVKENIDFKEKRELIEVLLKLSQNAPQKGFEMSILLEEDVKHFKYPTPFILHFSNDHKERYQRDCSYICENGEDTDLAAHITITISRGICLFGKPIKDTFESVPPKYYIESIVKDIVDAKEEITNSPTYFILNLCRVLYYLREGAICSKKEGGEWAYSHVPTQYGEVIKEALLAYKNGSSINCNSKLLTDFADFIMREISLIHNISIS